LLVIGVVLGLMSAGAWAGEASVMGAGTPPPSGGAGELETAWSSNHFALDISGVPEEIITGQDSFIFDMMAVPGTTVYRVMTVSNVGTADGVLEAAVLDPTVDQPDGAVNHELADYSNIFWSFDSGPSGKVGFATAKDQAEEFVMSGGSTHFRYPMDEVALPAGSSVYLTMGWELPMDAELGNRMGAPSVSLSFDVDLLLRPPTADDPFIIDPTKPPVRPGPIVGPTVRPPSSETAPPGGSVVAPDAGQGTLPFTGTHSMGLAFGSVACLLAGLLILAARRRRRQEEQAEATD